jgi:methyltransferase (TIGR00027 family)
LQDASGPRKGHRPPVRYSLIRDSSHLFRPAARTQAQKEDALPRLNLEHHRKRARALLKGVHAHEPDALCRFDRVVIRATAQPSAALHEAQLVIARESGFPSWARLKAHIRAERMRSPLTLTALVAAANRALETELPHPLYRDPFARDLAGDVGWSMLAAMRRTSWPGYTTGPDPYLTIVTKSFDDALQRVVNESAITQVVIMSAGMDTRAFRLEWPSTVRIFEIDRADVFHHKEMVLDRLRARATCRRRTVQADLSRSWSPALLRAGFVPKRKTAFLMERAQYFDSAVMTRLLHEINTLSSPGSWMGLACMTEETRVSPFMTPFLQKLEALGFPPWKFGVDDPESWLATLGWEATSVVAGAPEASYGRWPYAYIPRSTPAIPRAFLTQAWMSGREGAWQESR